jgi:hypothetical protein
MIVDRKTVNGLYTLSDKYPANGDPTSAAVWATPERIDAATYASWHVVLISGFDGSVSIHFPDEMKLAYTQRGIKIETITVSPLAKKPEIRKPNNEPAMYPSNILGFRIANSPSVRIGTILFTFPWATSSSSSEEEVLDALQLLGNSITGRRRAKNRNRLNAKDRLATITYVFRRPVTASSHKIGIRRKTNRANKAPDPEQTPIRPETRPFNKMIKEYLV